MVLKGKRDFLILWLTIFRFLERTWTLLSDRSRLQGAVVRLYKLDLVFLKMFYLLFEFNFLDFMWR